MHPIVTEWWTLRPPTHGTGDEDHAMDTPNSIELRTVDLGGQLTYYVTHPLFFSERALYLLCWCHKDLDAHKDYRGHESHMASFVRVVHAMAPESPLRVAATKCNNATEHALVVDAVARVRSAHTDLHQLPRDKNGVVGTESKKGDGFQELRQVMWDAFMQHLPHAQHPLPDAYEDLIGRLKHRAQELKAADRPPVVHLEEVLLLAQASKLVGVAAQATALGLLRDLALIVVGKRRDLEDRIKHVAKTLDSSDFDGGGSDNDSDSGSVGTGQGVGQGAGGGADADSCSAPPAKPSKGVADEHEDAVEDGATKADNIKIGTWSVEDVVVLDPEWLADVMKCLVTVSKANLSVVPGKLFAKDIKAAWDSGGYPATLRPLLLDLLQAYEVVYPARNLDGSFAGYYVVPGMLQDVPEPSHASDFLKAKGDEQVLQAASVRRAAPAPVLIDLVAHRAHCTGLFGRSIGASRLCTDGMPSL